MEAYGSQDDIEDALDILRAAGVYFALVVGVPGEAQSRTYFSEYLSVPLIDEVSEDMDDVLTKVFNGFGA